MYDLLSNIISLVLTCPHAGVSMPRPTGRWDLPSSHHLCLLFKIHLNRIHPVLLVALGSTDCPAFLKDGEVGLCWEIKTGQKSLKLNLEGKQE